MMNYPDDMIIKDALTKYFRDNFQRDIGYGERWVKVKMGPITISFLNTDARRRAVKYHDIHHILTEYPTTMLGEAQIGAWELTSGGCRWHWPAWILDILAVFFGLFISPKVVLKAFMDGCNCKNLYEYDYNEELLRKTVGELRKKQGIKI